jgi:hypothetical protein
VNRSTLWCNEDLYDDNISGDSNSTMLIFQVVHCCPRAANDTCSLGDGTDIIPKSRTEATFIFTCPAPRATIELLTLLLCLALASITPITLP